ncbi:hypothetical protein EPIB1_945 [Tritonibacter mobilis]|uniref:hypothetical protein n=1 Tax=Tritonibacter mobilis TaxID=379347 RepID=UPI000F70C6CF|nr:hypothetical protein [Tritonibacter mobilis]VCU58047.1 hypothetical protein EPIB1_945 [Tritonibacter mobilis]
MTDSTDPQGETGQFFIGGIYDLRGTQKLTVVQPAALVGWGLMLLKNSGLERRQGF